MKRILAMLLMLVMIAGCALAESPMKGVFDAASELLFASDDVTVTGEATFSLDGQRFKTAQVRYLQDTFRSLWELKLKTPRANGTERETGYTIIGDGEKIYVMEAYYPGTYKTGLSDRQNTILRRSLQLDLVAGLFGQLAEQAETLLPEGAVTVESGAEKGTVVRLHLGEDMPEIANTALNLAAQFAAKRWFFADPDRMDDEHMVPMNSYLTPTQGIVFSTKSYRMKEADITFQMNADGQLEEMAGTAALRLNTGWDEEHLLETAFRLEVSDWATTKVDAFDPAAWGVRLPEGAIDLTVYDTEQYTEENQDAAFETGMLPEAPEGVAIEEMNIPEVPEYTGKLESRAIAGEEEAIAYAKEIWALDYLQAGDLSRAEWEVLEEGDTYSVAALLPGEAQTMKVLFRKDGTVLRVSNGVSGWEDARTISPDAYATDGHDRWREVLSIRVMEGFAEAVNEGSTDAYHAMNPADYSNGVYFTGYDSVLAEGNNLYMNFYTDPNEERTARTRFMVQVLPVTRIVLFDTLVPVEEGGNG